MNTRRQRYPDDSDTQRTDVTRSEIRPPRADERGEPDGRANGFVLVRRMLVYGSVSALLALVIYVFMVDPTGDLYRLTGWRSSMSVQGLLVYSSIVALVLFLVILLFRYMALINLAYLNTVKTSVDGRGDGSFTPPVSVIVPAYNEGKLLESVVDSLLAMDYPEYEIIIVDDGSTDDTRKIARRLVGRYRDGAVSIRLIEKPNGGKATALNAGIRVASHDFLLNVDGDSQLSPETLRRSIRHFRDERLGAIAGNVKVLNRKSVWTTLQALEYVEGLNMARSAQSFLKLVNIIPGPLGVFRKQAVMDAGMYSSDTFAEDTDLTLKIIRAGWKVEYEPEAKSYTEAPERLTDLLKQRYRWTRGILQAVRKHRDLFVNPTINFGGTLVMWSMAFESLIWPVMNVFVNLYFIIIAVVFGLTTYLVYWWLSLTLLDLIAALYCVAVEKEEVRLVFYSLFYRIFFILIIDVCKTVATIEEYLGVGMTWGKLERIGSGARA